MSSMIENDHVLDQIVFVGESLGPLFLYEPVFKSEQVAPLLQAFADIDADAAGADWPFVEAYTASGLLSGMKAGLAQGIDADALVDDYRRLFVGPGPKACPPWGSVYTDPDQVIFGESTLALRRWLKREGIAFDFGDSEEPDDHIGALLVLMAWIARNRPELAEEFLKEHLLPWALHFLTLMQKEAAHPFYRGLAQLTSLTLAGMQKDLDLHVDEPNFYR